MHTHMVGTWIWDLSQGLWVLGFGFGIVQVSYNEWRLGYGVWSRRSKEVLIMVKT